MPTHTRTGATALALALTLGLPLVASASDALRVVRDPQTKELRPPNATETLALEKAEAQLRAARTTQPGTTQATQQSGPREIHHPDGSVEMVLGEESHLYSVVKRNDDGLLHYECLPAAEAAHFVKFPADNAAKGAAKAGHAHP